VDTELGLKAYMNTLITTHEVISQFKLKRVLKYWGFKDAKHIYFMLAPQWIRFNPAVAYSQILKGGEGDSGDEEKKGLNIVNPLREQGNKNSLVKDPQLFSKDIEI